VKRRAGSVTESGHDATSGELLRTCLSRSAQRRRGEIQRLMEQGSPARSARTRRLIGSVCWRPRSRDTWMSVVRNRPSIKYSDIDVQHCNNLPVPPRLLAASCPLAFVPIQTYLPARAAFGTLAGVEFCADFSCSSRRGSTAPTGEKFRHRSPLPTLLWVTTQQSLGKHRQRAHRRRFARPPRF
jgi:hypothetical protein